MAQSAATIWRDFETDGIPASGNWKPRKVELREWGTSLETITSAFTTNGGLVFSTKSIMDTSLNFDNPRMAWVISDPVVANNGVYRKQGASGTGSWVRMADLPYSFIRASDAGAGTANAIVATSSIPLPIADGGALIALNIFETNTGSPVTVSFNGGSALTIKTNSGNDVAAGGLTAGMIVAGYVSGSTFRLLSDQASAAIVAAAEAAQVAAEAAADRAEDASSVAVGSMTTVIDPQFSNRATAQAYAPTVAPSYIRTAAYATAGDGGGALYAAVGSEPSHDGKLSIALADGVTVQWYELSEALVDERMFGATGSNGTIDTAALQSLFDFGAAKDQAVWWVGRGYAVNATLDIPENLVVYCIGGPVFFNAGSYHVEKAFNGDLFTMGRATQIHDLTVNGKGATYTGRGAVISVGGDQRLLNCNLLYFSDYCVEYVGSSVGIRSQIKGGWYTRTTAGGISIKWPDEASNGNRLVEGVYGDVMHVGGSDNGSIVGCNFANIVFGATSKKTKVVGTRISNAAIPATCTVLGVDHVFSGNVFSGDVDIQSTTTYFDESNRVAAALTSSAPSATNRISLGPVSYTPTWTASTTNPTIGNGSVDAEYELDGAYCIVRIRMNAGSTTNFGSGVWSFSLPLAPKTATRARFGNAYAFDSGTSFLPGLSVIQSGGTTVQCLIGSAPSNYAGATTPISWASGDRLELEIRYRIN